MEKRKINRDRPRVQQSREKLANSQKEKREKKRKKKEEYRWKKVSKKIMRKQRETKIGESGERKNKKEELSY